MRTKPIVFFISVKPNGPLLNFSLLIVCLSDIKVSGRFVGRLFKVLEMSWSVLVNVWASWM